MWFFYNDLPLAYCLLRIFRNLYEIFNFHNNIIRVIVSHIWESFSEESFQRGQILATELILLTKTIFASISLEIFVYSTSFSTWRITNSQIHLFHKNNWSFVFLSWASRQFQSFSWPDLLSCLPPSEQIDESWLHQSSFSLITSS